MFCSCFLNHSSAWGKVWGDQKMWCSLKRKEFNDLQLWSQPESHQMCIMMKEDSMLSHGCNSILENGVDFRPNTLNKQFPVNPLDDIRIWYGLNIVRASYWMCHIFRVNFAYENGFLSVLMWQCHCLHYHYRFNSTGEWISFVQIHTVLLNALHLYINLCMFF